MSIMLNKIFSDQPVGTSAHFSRKRNFNDALKTVIKLFFFIRFNWREKEKEIVQTQILLDVLQINVSAFVNYEEVNIFCLVEFKVCFQTKWIMNSRKKDRLICVGMWINGQNGVWWRFCMFITEQNTIRFFVSFKYSLHTNAHREGRRRCFILYIYVLRYFVCDMCGCGYVSKPYVLFVDYILVIAHSPPFVVRKKNQSLIYLYLYIL